MSRRGRGRGRGPRPAPDSGQHSGDAAAGLGRIMPRDRPYEFTVDGVTHRLPPAGAVADKCLTGGIVLDIMADESKGSMKLAVAMITHAEMPPAAVSALRSLPAADFMHHLNRWLRSGGVDTGKYLRSDG